MLDLILKGIITGFLLSIMIGPVFFILLETSIRKGVRSAIAFDTGVLVSDLIYILIAYEFYSEVAGMTKDSELAQIIGGCLFIIYGIVNFFKKSKPTAVDEDGKVIQNKKDYNLLFIKGFLLNFANPMVIFYWFTVMTIGAKSSHLPKGQQSVQILFFLAVILVTFFSIDLLKIFGAKKLRPLVTDNLLKALNQLIGIVFMGFGIFSLIHGIIGSM